MDTVKYKYSTYAIVLSGLIAALAAYLFPWHSGGTASFIDGDPEYYYYYLQSTFVDSSFIKYEWLSDPNGMHHHPVGLSVIMLPFFIAALLYANLSGYALDGFSAPFQFSFSVAAIFFCLLGLVYLRKLFQLNNISDKVSALIITLVFLGTTLFHYTVMEPSMSHVYSFCFVAIFLYHANKFVLQQQNKNLVFASLALGFIILLRPNNIFVLLSLPFWFTSFSAFVSFIRSLVRQRTFYYCIAILLGFFLFQLLTWYVKEPVLYSNRYAGFGFHWLHPHLLQMLFGFDAGFFIYAPLCFVFLLGIISVYRENRFMFFGVLLFFAIFFYFLSSYNAYTYFDGLGIRVLVDFYPVFALLGAKLFMQLQNKKLAYAFVLTLCILLSGISLVYSYQDHKGILLRSGMTYNQWKYVFLKTGAEYQHCLGGSNDLTPYAAEQPAVALEQQFPTDQPFDYSKRDFGVMVSFDSLGFNSNQVQLKINCARKELVRNSSDKALICASLEDTNGKKNKLYSSFKLNETPATDCCEEKEYAYTCTMHGDFRASDRLAVYVWNMEMQPFLINKFSVQVYNYNYQIN